MEERANGIFEEMAQRVPSRACIACGNCDPGADGGCFLRLQPKLDLGIKEYGFSTILQPISSLQSVSPVMIRDLLCEGYNDESSGYPDEHPKHGGWVCSVCGFYLSRKDSVDSREKNLPKNLRKCPKCGTYDPHGCDGFYSV